MNGLTYNMTVAGMSFIGPPGTYARLNGPLPVTAEEILKFFPELVTPVTKEVIDEAILFFKRIYHYPQPIVTIDEALELLKDLRRSPNIREREVFCVIIKHLFDEYKFFPEYRRRRLLIAAQLFGGIIERNILADTVALGLALRFLLDAVRKPHGSKLYLFGITALTCFKTRLLEYQWYLENVPNFKDVPSHLLEE